METTRTEQSTKQTQPDANLLWLMGTDHPDIFDEDYRNEAYPMIYPNEILVTPIRRSDRGRIRAFELDFRNLSYGALPAPTQRWAFSTPDGKYHYHGNVRKAERAQYKYSYRAQMLKWQERQAGSKANVPTNFKSVCMNMGDDSRDTQNKHTTATKPPREHAAEMQHAPVAGPAVSPFDIHGNQRADLSHNLGSIPVTIDASRLPCGSTILLNTTDERVRVNIREHGIARLTRLTKTPEEQQTVWQLPVIGDRAGASASLRSFTNLRLNALDPRINSPTAPTLTSAEGTGVSSNGFASSRLLNAQGISNVQRAQKETETDAVDHKNNHLALSLSHSIILPDVQEGYEAPKIGQEATRSEVTEEAAESKGKNPYILSPLAPTEFSISNQAGISDIEGGFTEAMDMQATATDSVEAAQGKPDTSDNETTTTGLHVDFSAFKRDIYPAIAGPLKATRPVSTTLITKFKKEIMDHDNEDLYAPPIPPRGVYEIEESEEEEDTQIGFDEDEAIEELPAAFSETSKAKWKERVTMKPEESLFEDTLSEASSMLPASNAVPNDVVQNKAQRVSGALNGDRKMLDRQLGGPDGQSSMQDDMPDCLPEVAAEPNSQEDQRETIDDAESDLPDGTCPACEETIKQSETRAIICCDRNIAHTEEVWYHLHPSCCGRKTAPKGDWMCRPCLETTKQSGKESRKETKSNTKRSRGKSDNAPKPRPNKRSRTQK